MNTATPPPTPTPSPTPIRAPRPVFLPLALREACVIAQRRVDVALVIDASTSMQQPTRAGGTKLAAAVAAVSAFLDELQLGAGDQAAIISFNADAYVLQRLTSDRQSLDTALGRIEMASTTRLDRAVEAAHEVLVGQERRAGNAPAMVLLTDGKANPVGPEAAVEQARAAKADGITIFTIGLGEELDLEALGAIASKPEYLHHAPDGENLEAIYRAIAVEIPCPAERFWGRR
jgi:Mg-chelatase subunit ChlD